MDNIAGFSKSHAIKLARAIRERENNEMPSKKCPRLGDSAPVSFPDPAKDNDNFDDDQVAPDQEDYMINDDYTDDDVPMRQVREEDFEDAECDDDDLDELLSGSDILPEEREAPILNDLRKWALSSRIARVHVNSLLKVLNKHYGSTFPKDSRTLLRTPRKPTIPIPMGPGEYFHYGLEKGLLSYPSGLLLIKMDKIILDISTDGFQMANSSKRCGWPIFASIYGTSFEPFLVGLYVGLAPIKSVDTFMVYFCEELGQLTANGGLSIPDPVVPIEIRCVITDSVDRGVRT